MLQLRAGAAKETILKIHSVYPTHSILILARNNNMINNMFEDKELRDEVGTKIKLLKHSDIDIDAMTIHKSKGLEYPVCYFSGLYKEFNISDLKERFLVDKYYGIIVPYFNEGIGNTIYKELLKQNYLKEEISEKIRLFYVALTRAREKIILVKPVNEKEYDQSNVTVLANSIKSKYRSLADMLDTIEFRISSKYKTIDLGTLKLTKDYAIVSQSNFKEYSLI